MSIFAAVPSGQGRNIYVGSTYWDDGNRVPLVHREKRTDAVLRLCDSDFSPIASAFLKKTMNGFSAS